VNVKPRRRARESIWPSGLTCWHVGGETTPSGLVEKSAYLGYTNDRDGAFKASIMAQSRNSVPKSS